MNLSPRPKTAASSRLRRLLAAGAISLLAAGSTAALAKDAALFSDVTSFKLDNGMQVVVIPDHRAPVVTHMVWYKVGAADEPAGQSGIAHFLEHLMFKGTDKIKAGDFSKIIRQKGGEDNAFTSADYTAYFQRIAREQLPMVMEMEADRLANLKLTKQDVDTEREVIIEERRSRIENDPSSRLMEQMDAALFLNHPYQRPVIGWMSEMQELSQQDALDFYKRYYTPSNAILVVAGDTTPEEVRKLAELHYGGLKNTAEPGERKRLVEPKPEAAREVVLKDANVSDPQVMRSYLTVAASKAEPGEAAALDVLSNILGGGPTSMLYRDLVIDKRLVSSAAAWYNGDSLDYGKFGVYATPLPESDPAAVDAAIDAVIERAKQGDFSEDQLADAKTSLVAQSIYALDNQARLARVFGTALTTGQTVEDVQLWPERVKAVTKDEVAAVARKYLNPERSVTGRLLPVMSASAQAAQPPAAHGQESAPPPPETDDVNKQPAKKEGQS